jgi:hypothetical protein
MGLRDELAKSAYVGLNDQQCLDALNATVTLSTDSTPYTWSGLGIKLLAIGVSGSIVMNARSLIQAVTPGGAMLDGCLSSGGFDCSSDENRALISAAGVSAPPDAVTLINGLLSIGKTTGSLWQSCCGSQPSLSDVTTARAQNANQSAKMSLMNSVINSNLANENVTLAQFKSAIANG